MTTTQDVKNIMKIHQAIVMALAEYAEKEERDDQNIAAHTFVAIVTVAFQINRDFAKGTLSQAWEIAEPIAVLIDSIMKNSANEQQQPPSEQAVS